MAARTHYMDIDETSKLKITQFCVHFKGGHLNRGGVCKQKCVNLYDNHFHKTERKNTPASQENVISCVKK